MQFKNIYNCPNGGTAIGLIAANEETQYLLNKFRDYYSEITGIRMPNHENYDFHITLSYKIEYLNANEQKELENTTLEVNRYLSQKMPQFILNTVDFCEFHDMFEFKPLHIIR